MRRPGQGRATQGAALGTRRRGWGPARAGQGKEDGSLETRQSKGRGGDPVPGCRGVSGPAGLQGHAP